MTAPTLNRSPRQVPNVLLRPGYEGANIRTWVGFKHFLYLAEAAVLDRFRQRGLGPQRLYHEFGVGLCVTDVSALLPSVLEVDDQVSAEVTETAEPGQYAVRLRAIRDDAPPTVLRGKVRVALVRDAAVPAGPALPVELAAMAAARPSAKRQPEPLPGMSFEWALTAAYYHCQFSEWVQHSTYVRLLEETVDRFLAVRGISVPRMLTERGWIPVVSRVRVRQHERARMGESIAVRFAVTDVWRDTTWDARMECSVIRDGEPVPVASAEIQHGYAVSRGPQAGELANLDQEVLAALRGDAP